MYFLTSQNNRSFSDRSDLMTEFARQIAATWNLTPQLSEMLAECFRAGDTPYYLAEYRPEVVMELSVSILWEIWERLQQLEGIAAKRKRVVNAFAKANRLTPELERRIMATTNTFELDDLLLPLRPNPRSRGQLAIKKGLGQLADAIAAQEDDGFSIEERAAAFSAANPSAGSAAQVLEGVKDVLAERFAYDETVRTMSRDFAYEDGHFEVTPKNRRDARFANYVDKQPAVADLTKEELLFLLSAEDSKAVRCKLSVQLFRITELLRHHLIVNPDFSGFDFLCEAIDEAWSRLLQPIIERDVKQRLREEAETWATSRLIPELERKFAEDQRRGTVMFADAENPACVVLIVVNGRGELQSATSEKLAPDGNLSSPDRMRKFFLRHRPSEVVVCDNPQAEVAEAVIGQITEGSEQPPVVTRFSPPEGGANPVEAEWVKKNYDSLLDDDTRKLYGVALLYLRPATLLPHLGLDCYDVHPLQRQFSKERFLEILERIVIDEELHRGVSIKEIADSRLSGLACVTPEILSAIRAADAKEPLESKAALLGVPRMTEVVYRNIAGFVVIPLAGEPRDRSLVHPDHYSWLDAAAEQLNVSLDTIMADPDILRSCVIDDYVKKIFVEKKLISQIQAGGRLSSAARGAKRKFKLDELKEGAIIAGRVTNITPFGVFVNINAVCDGLIHISQLADDYVETPEQVVSMHDRVDVRILKIDVKKRRISLSMKNLGRPGPKVKPSTGQLSTLAEHFKNR